MTAYSNLISPIPANSLDYCNSRFCAACNCPYMLMSQSQITSCLAFNVIDLCNVHLKTLKRKLWKVHMTSMLKCILHI